jgi:hypothetical protein
MQFHVPHAIVCYAVVFHIAPLTTTTMTTTRPASSLLFAHPLMVAILKLPGIYQAAWLVDVCVCVCCFSLSLSLFLLVAG